MVQTPYESVDIESELMRIYNGYQLLHSATGERACDTSPIDTPGDAGAAE